MSNDWERERRRKRFKNKKKKDKYKDYNIQKKKQEEQEYLDKINELYGEWFEEDIENFYNSRESLRYHASIDQQEKRD